MEQADFREEQQPSHTEGTMWKYTLHVMWLEEVDTEEQTEGGQRQHAERDMYGDSFSAFCHTDTVL